MLLDLLADLVACVDERLPTSTSLEGRFEGAPQGLEPRDPFVALPLQEHMLRMSATTTASQPAKQDQQTEVCLPSKLSQAVQDCIVRRHYVDRALAVLHPRQLSMVIGLVELLALPHYIEDRLSRVVWFDGQAHRAAATR